MTGFSVEQRDAHHFEVLAHGDSTRPVAQVVAYADSKDMAETVATALAEWEERQQGPPTVWVAVTEVGLWFADGHDVYRVDAPTHPVPAGRSRSILRGLLAYVRSECDRADGLPP